MNISIICPKCWKICVCGSKLQKMCSSAKKCSSPAFWSIKSVNWTGFSSTEPQECLGDGTGTDWKSKEGIKATLLLVQRREKMDALWPGKRKRTEEDGNFWTWDCKLDTCQWSGKILFSVPHCLQWGPHVHKWCCTQWFCRRVQRKGWRGRMPWLYSHRPNPARNNSQNLQT